MRPSWDEYFFDIAKVVSTRATCPRKSVGVVIVDEYDKRIVATGYNGSEAGAPHCDDVGCKLVNDSCRRAVHAEVNALSKLEFYMYDDDRQLLAGKWTWYMTLEPCKKCLSEIKKRAPIWGHFKLKWLESYHSDKGEGELIIGPG